MDHPEDHEYPFSYVTLGLYLRDTTEESRLNKEMSFIHVSYFVIIKKSAAQEK